MPGAAGAVSGKPAGFSWISLFAVEAFRYLFDLVVEVIPLGAELLEDIPQRLLAHVVLQEVVGEELDDLAQVRGYDFLVVLEGDLQVRVPAVVHRFAHGRTVEHEHGRMGGAQRVERGVRPVRRFAGPLELVGDAVLRVHGVAGQRAVALEQHAVRGLVVAVFADVLADHRDQHHGDGRVAYARLGLGRVEDERARVVGILVDAVANVEYPVVEVQVPQSQRACLAHAQSADERCQPYHQLQVVRHRVDDGAHLVLGERQLVGFPAFGLGMLDAAWIVGEHGLAVGQDLLGRVVEQLRDDHAFMPEHGRGQLVLPARIPVLDFPGRDLAYWFGSEIVLEPRQRPLEDLPP